MFPTHAFDYKNTNFIYYTLPNDEYLKLKAMTTAGKVKKLIALERY